MSPVERQIEWCIFLCVAGFLTTDGVLPSNAPDEPEDFKHILNDVDKFIMPGVRLDCIKVEANPIKLFLRQHFHAFSCFINYICNIPIYSILTFWNASDGWLEWCLQGLCNGISAVSWVWNFNGLELPIYCFLQLIKRRRKFLSHYTTYISSCIRNH